MRSPGVYIFKLVIFRWSVFRFSVLAMADFTNLENANELVLGTLSDVNKEVFEIWVEQRGLNART